MLTSTFALLLDPSTARKLNYVFVMVAPQCDSWRPNYAICMVLPYSILERGGALVNLSANLPSKAFENLLSYLEGEYENYSLCAYALGSMKGVSQLARALEKTEKEIKETEEIELKITKEVESGLPKLNSHVLVNIWSAFETCFNEYCVL